jgi:hypothetical protein
MFRLLQETLVEDKAAPLEVEDAAALESQKTYFRISHFIKPDMLINVYGLVDFWLKEICDYHRRKNNASLSYRDIKSTDGGDLRAYQKYLTKYIGLNLAAVDASYARLQNLRDVRNRLIHRGGHVSDGDRSVERLSAIPGIAVAGTLIVIDDSFVWDVLTCANTYLRAAAQA